MLIFTYIKICKFFKFVNIISSCNTITKPERFTYSRNENKEDFIMKTAVKILKIVGRTAASVIIWAAGILERRE